MPVRVYPFKSFTTTKQPLSRMVRASQYNLASQLQKPSSLGIVNGPNPIGQKEGDTITRYLPSGALAISVYDAKGQPATSIIAADSKSATAFQTGTVPPTVANFPAPGDNGQYLDTVLNQLYIVRNYNGSLIFPNFVSISGTITAAQHGDLSAATFTAHKFAQISGTITATQHSNFAAAAANDALHAPADASHPGFMSIGQFNLLAGATDAATANTLCKRDASGNADFNLCNAVTFDASNQYRVDGDRVVFNRQLGWTLWTGTLDRTTAATYTDPGFVTTPTLAQFQAMAAALQNVSRGFAAMLDDLFVTNGHGLLGS